MKMNKDKKEMIGVVGQFGCSVLIAFAIGLEIASGAELGYILITLGAVAWAIFTKIRGS